MVSEKAKEYIGGAPGLVGLAGFILAAVIAIALFGPFFEFTLFKIDMGLAIFFLTIGIAMFVVGIKKANVRGRKGMKEKIADFANQTLKSKGKVSLQQIITNTKINPLFVQTLLPDMIKQGYFEDARFADGWLVRDVINCPYCGVSVSLTQSKCSECGAQIKK